MMEDWILCRDCEHCIKPKWMVDFKASCDVDDTIIGVYVPRVCPNYIPVRDDSTCEGFVKVNEDILKSKEENTMNETGKIFDEISEILNKKNEEIEELHKKLIAFEAANKENKKLVERLDERISEKNIEIEELEKKISAYEKDRNKRQVFIDEINDKLIKTRSEVNEANIRNNLLAKRNEELVKDNLEHLEENRGLVEECGKLHVILCKNCKYDNDVDDVCFRACKCGSHFCPEDSKELHKKIECLEEQNRGLAGEGMKLFGEKHHLEKLVEEKNKEINSLNITKEFYINRAKDLAAERDDFSKKWDASICELGEKIREIDELKKQNDSVFYDILDSDRIGTPHSVKDGAENRYPIYRDYTPYNSPDTDCEIVGYLYVKSCDEKCGPLMNSCSVSIGEVKSWCIGEGEIYDDDTKYVKIPRHHIAIVPMRKDGIEAAEKWVIE